MSSIPAISRERVGQTEKDLSASLGRMGRDASFPALGRMGESKPGRSDPALIEERTALAS